jgi:hypothetical protein
LKSYPFTLKVSFRYVGTLVAARVASRIDSTGNKEVIEFTSAEPANVAAWPEPPHVALANVGGRSLETGLQTSLATPARLDLKALVRFVERYGVPVHAGWPDDSGKYEVDLTEVAKLQFVLRSAWHHDTEALKLIASEQTDSPGGFDWSCWKRAGELFESYPTDGFFFARPVALRRRMELVFMDLGSLVQWLFLVDFWNERTGICSNKECFTPYFILKRKGQIYCSHDCAAKIAVERYRRKTKAVIAEARAKGNWPGRQR